MTRKIHVLMENDCRKWHPQERNTWRYGARSAMPAAKVKKPADDSDGIPKCFFL